MCIYGQNVCVARGPAGTFNGKLKDVACVSILGIGEADHLSCLGVGSLDLTPSQTRNPKP